MSKDDPRTKRVLIHRSVKGSLGQTEDWWTLLINAENGQKLVEQEWSYVNPYNPSKDPPGSAGTRTMPVNEFLRSEESNKTVKSKLQDLLKMIGA
jgi:hypothetical protein